MLVHNINNNPLISNPSYLSIYHEKSEKWELYQKINISNLNQTEKL